MVEQNPPDFEQSGCWTAEGFRHIFNSMICVEGVIGVDDLLVTAVGGASVNVSVAAGSAWVEGTINGAEGMYRVYNDAAEVQTITANGAGTARIDLVIATVYDSQYAGGVDQWAIEVITGVAGGGVPAVPNSTRAGYVVLAEVTVPAAGATPSVVEDVRPRMSTCGAQPVVVLRASGPTSLPASNVEEQIEVSIIERTDSAFYDTSVANQVTVLQDGLYDVWGYISASTVVNKPVGVVVYNAAVPVAGAVSQAGNPNGGWAHPAHELSYQLSAGAQIWLWGAQGDGSAHDADDGRLLIRKVG